MKDFNSIDEIRELGKTLFFRGNDEQQKELGLSMLIRAKEQRDPEAMYIIARLLLDGLLKTKGNDTVQYALELLCVSANRGFMLARAFLDSYCEERYRLGYSGEFRDPPKGSLVDFDGKIIKSIVRGCLLLLMPFLNIRMAGTS